MNRFKGTVILPADRERLTWRDVDRMNLETGDLVLFQSIFLRGQAIRYFTQSKWSHVGLIVRDRASGTIWVLETTTKWKRITVLPLTFVANVYGGEIQIRRLYRTFMPHELDLLEKLIYESSDVPFNSSVIEWVGAFLSHWSRRLEMSTGIQAFRRQRKTSTGYFCAQLAAKGLQGLGFDLGCTDNMLVPEDFTESSTCPALRTVEEGGRYHSGYDTSYMVSTNAITRDYDNGDRGLVWEQCPRSEQTRSLELWEI